MNKGRIISEFLVNLAREIENLNDEELELLFQEIGIVDLLRKRQKYPAIKKSERMEVQLEAAAIMTALSDQESREKATELLIRLSPSRRVLIEAAKTREIYISRNDTVKTISEKIVENVVGSRLDSARIRGNY